ncbi:MAG TPA: RNA polymerase factor sigma-32 [Candidatus Cybelea sp.]|nr:RNA polymerase factor sigma-32 [Candidatus Cybelea sp.]
MSTAAESSQAIRRNRRFVATAMETPLLSQEEEFALARSWREGKDEAALHRLVSAYMRLVVSIAGRFRTYGLPMSDLVQEGNVGLMQAAARFEPAREVRFSTYASWWIRSAMQEFVLRNWSIVRTGTSANQKALFFNLRWLRAKIERGARAGANAGLNERVQAKIASDLKVPIGDVRVMAQRLSGRDQSLNEPVGEEGVDEWEDFLTDPGPTPEEIVIDRHDGAIRNRWLEEALGELNDREQMIIRARRLKDERATLEELGSKLGITKERVRQIEHKAFEKLRVAVLRHSRDIEPVALRH